MIGWVYVMTPDDYAAWLNGGEKNESMAQTGRAAVYPTRLRLLPRGRWHAARARLSRESTATSVKLANGDIHDSWMNPDSPGDRVSEFRAALPNYKQIMPTFQGQVDEEQVLQLVAYVKSLGLQERSNGK